MKEEEAAAAARKLFKAYLAAAAAAAAGDDVCHSAAILQARVVKGTFPSGLNKCAHKCEVLQMGLPCIRADGNSDVALL